MTTLFLLAWVAVLVGIACIPRNSQDTAGVIGALVLALLTGLGILHTALRTFG